MKKIIFTLLGVALIFGACGYKPSSYYAKKMFAGKVFVDVDASAQDPQNSVLAKDALVDILVSRLNLKVVDERKDADVIMTTRLQSVSFSAIGYDTDGYVNTYRAHVSLLISYKTATKQSSITVSGNYDFALDSEVISDVKRYEAIKIASDKAMQDFVSQVAISNFRK